MLLSCGQALNKSRHLAAQIGSRAAELIRHRILFFKVMCDAGVHIAALWLCRSGGTCTYIYRIIGPGFSSHLPNALMIIDQPNASRTLVVERVYVYTCTGPCK